MDAAELAIAHDQDMIAGAADRHHMIDEGVKRLKYPPPLTERDRVSEQIPAEIRRAIQQGEIGGCKGAREFLAMGAQTQGIGARLEEGNDARRAQVLPQRFKGRMDRGWMMGKIIIHRDAIDQPYWLQAAFYVFELGECLAGDVRRFNPGMACRSNGG